MTIARLHLITPDSTDESVVVRTRLALAAGAPWVQVRTKTATDRDRLRFAATMVEACTDTDATCIIDDRADIARLAGSGGVHVGADDLPVRAVRTLLGPGTIVGATCRTADDARRAEADGASYVGVGPVYATTTKAGLPEPIGAAGLEIITAAVDLPVIAISGVTLDRIREVLAAGAHGVAVVAAIYGAADVAAATRAFLEQLAEGSQTVAAVPAGGGIAP